MSGTSSTSSSKPVQVTVKGPLRCEGPGRLQWGEDPTSAARVAVRFLPLSANGEAAVRSLTQLPRHPTLPKVLQIGTAETEAFAVLDFPQGRLLGSTLERPLELRRLVRMGHDLADALAAAHAEGIAHGELSAQSVLLLEDEQALLWDLPLVFVDRMTDRRGEGRVLQKLEATAEFLSPERAMGQPASAAADVWALGALICRAAGSERPKAPSTLGIVHQIASRAWSPRIPERLPARIRTLLAGMLASEASARLTAAQVKQELGAILLEATTLKDLPAQELAPVRMPSTGEDGDLVEMLRPDPPRSALPDVHAVPTLADREGEAALSQAVNLPSSPANPVAGAAVGAEGAPKPLVPWTDPRVRAFVDPELATVAHPLPKVEAPVPVVTDPSLAAVKATTSGSEVAPAVDAAMAAAGGASEAGASAAAAVTDPNAPASGASGASTSAATPTPAAVAGAPVVMRIGTPAVGPAPRMAPLDRVVEKSATDEELDLAAAALGPNRSLKRIAITAAIALPVVAMIALGIMMTLPWTRVKPPPARETPLTWEARPAQVAPTTPAPGEAPEAVAETEASEAAEAAEPAEVEELTPPVAEDRPQVLETTARFAHPTRDVRPAAAAVKTRKRRAKVKSEEEITETAEVAEPTPKAVTPAETKPAEKKSELKHLF